MNVQKSRADHTAKLPVYSCMAFPEKDIAEDPGTYKKIENCDNLRKIMNQYGITRPTFLPLYVQDFMADEKLSACSAAATGIYIRLMCIMHKSDEYGKVCYNKRDSRTDNIILDFARKLSKQMPYPEEEIYDGLHELLDLRIIHISGEKLVQKRMVKDGELSGKRAKSGKKGMLKRWESAGHENDVCYNKTDSKDDNKKITNSENEYENENHKDNREGGGGEEKISEIETVGCVKRVHAESAETDFESVWLLYGRKGNKKTSGVRWARLTPINKQAALTHIPKYVLATPDVIYRKNFETYINQEAWNDEIITSNGKRITSTGTTAFADENFLRGIAEGIQRGHSNRNQ